MLQVGQYLLSVMDEAVDGSSGAVAGSKNLSSSKPLSRKTQFTCSTSTTVPAVSHGRDGRWHTLRRGKCAQLCFQFIYQFTCSANAKVQILTKRTNKRPFHHFYLLS